MEKKRKNHIAIAKKKKRPCSVKCATGLTDLQGDRTTFNRPRFTEKQELVVKLLTKHKRKNIIELQR